MAHVATGKPLEADASANYGVELKEVDFKEFDRRKAPRLNTYASFVKYIDSVAIEPLLIEVKY